ncbi:MAG TPA: hypothetical protein VFW23_16115, partial [Tepidisphaeraceae bacterium]|nr:hypothetical protein [Tepidisphaeraceae bacterium]
ALAIAYYLWLRTRWMLASLVGVAVIAPLAQRIVVRLHGNVEYGGNMAPEVFSQLIMMIGLIATVIPFVLLVSQFSYAGKDVSGRESAFPRAMMTLPVRSVSLVAWPMLYGSTVCALACLLMFHLLLSRELFSGMPYWPLITAAAFCAWLQAVSWTPFWWHMARVVAAVICLTIIISLGVVAQALGVPDWLLVIAYLGVVMLALIAGTQGVARARRGDGVKSPWSEKSVQKRLRPVNRRLTFQSASAAMLWVEMRRNLIFTPFISLIGPVLIFGLCAFHAGHPSTFYLYGKMISSMMIMASIFIGSPLCCSLTVNGTLAKFDTWLPHITVPNFLAVRPVTDSQIVAAKIKNIAIAMAVTWLVTYLLLIVWALLPNSYERNHSVAGLVAAHFKVRYLWWGLIAAIGLPLICWKVAIQNLCVYLYGRRWLINSVGFATITIWIGLSALAKWAPWREIVPFLPWIALAFVLAKFVVAILIIRALVDRRLLSPKSLFRWSAVWLLIVLSLWLSVKVALHPQWLGQWLLAAAVIWFVPANRLLLAPLALHANRHR